MLSFPHSLLSRLLLACALAFPLLAQAQTPPPQVQGEIRKVDAEGGKLTIRHGDIPNLDMPGMTMVFKAAPALVARARAGEKIVFTADRIDGALTITTLEERQ